MILGFRRRASSDNKSTVHPCSRFQALRWIMQLDQLVYSRASRSYCARPDVRADQSSLIGKRKTQGVLKGGRSGRKASNLGHVLFRGRSPDFLTLARPRPSDLRNLPTAAWPRKSPSACLPSRSYHILHCVSAQSAAPTELLRNSAPHVSVDHERGQIQSPRRFSDH